MTIDMITNLLRLGRHRLAVIVCLAGAAMLLGGCEAINDPAYSGMRGTGDLPPPPQQVDTTQARPQPAPLAQSAPVAASPSASQRAEMRPVQERAGSQGDASIPPAPYRTTPEYQSPYPDYWRETQREDGRRDTLARADGPEPLSSSETPGGPEPLTDKVNNDIYVGDGRLPLPEPAAETMTRETAPSSSPEPSAVPTRAPRQEAVPPTAISPAAASQPASARVVGQAATSSDRPASATRQAASPVPTRSQPETDDGWTMDDEWTPPPPQVPVDAGTGSSASSMATAPASSSAAPPPERMTGSAYGLHLASYRRRDNAYRGWDVLTGAHPDLLAGFQPRLASADLPGLGLYYRLKAGPVADRDEAIALCRQIEARGDYCVVMAFDGESF